MKPNTQLSEARRAALVGALYAALDYLLRTGRDEGKPFDRVVELIRERDKAILQKKLQTIEHENSRIH